MGEKTLNVFLIRHTAGPQELIALAAKLCYSNLSGINELKEGIESKSQEKFLDKLVNIGHLSPIEHSSFSFGIEGVSRSLLAQISRHRIMSLSVRSQRFCKEDDFGYIIPPRIAALGPECVDEFKRQMAVIQEWYDSWVKKLGDAGESSNEDARFVLPNACETKMIVTMNARELLHFFNQRCCNRAQWEIRALAYEMLQLVKKEAPALFKNAGPACVKLGYCPEGNMTCGKIAEVKELYTNIS